MPVDSVTHNDDGYRNDNISVAFKCRGRCSCLSLPSPPLSERRRYCDARRHAVTLCVSAALFSAAKVMRCIHVLSSYHENLNEDRPILSATKTLNGLNGHFTLNFYVRFSWWAPKDARVLKKNSA